MTYIISIFHLKFLNKKIFGIEYKKNINIEKVLFLNLFKYDINLKPHKIPDNIL